MVPNISVNECVQAKKFPPLQMDHRRYLRTGPCFFLAAKESTRTAPSSPCSRPSSWGTASLGRRTPLESSNLIYRGSSRTRMIGNEVIKEFIWLSYSGRTVISGEEFSAQKFRDDLDNVAKILCIEDILEDELTYQIGRAPSTAAWESSACPTCVPQQFFSGGHEAGAGRLHNHR